MVEKIQEEENICLNVKVQIRLIQQQEAAAAANDPPDQILMVFWEA